MILVELQINNIVALLKIS